MTLTPSLRNRVRRLEEATASQDVIAVVFRPDPGWTPSQRTRAERDAAGLVRHLHDQGAGAVYVANIARFPL